MRHPYHPSLNTTVHLLWDDHVVYILGDTVWGLCAAESLGDSSKVDWGTVMDYEYEIRREAIRKIVYEHKDIALAMREARQDQELRSIKLVTPALAQAAASAATAAVHASGARRVPPPPAWRGDDRSRSPDRYQDRSSKGGKGNGKGGKNNLARGPRRRLAAHEDKKRAELKNKTADGKDICYRFNRKG